MLNTHKAKGIVFSIIAKFILYFVLISFAFVFLYPYIYMLTMSVKSYSDIMNITVKWLPRDFTLDNYKVALLALNFGRSFVNSVFLTSIATIAHLLSCSFIGYGFARFNFKFRNVWFFIVLLSLVIPIQTIIIPQYINYVSLSMTDSYLPFILPSFLGYGLRGGLFIFLFRQYFMRLPKSLEEAASIDGCGAIKTFFKIALPTAGPVILVTLVLSMVWHWNDYYEPSIYLSANSRYVLLPQMLPSMYTMIENIKSSPELMSASWMADMKFKFHEGVVMAGTAVATFPVLFAYLFLQRKFMQGVERSGMTGE